MRAPAFSLALAFCLSVAACADPATAVAAQTAPAEAKLWHPSWPDFSLSEGVATATAGALTGALALRGAPQEPHWQGGILFDDYFRRRLRLQSADARQTARRLGDWPYYTAPALPLVLDPLLALLVHDDARASLNLELIGLEAFSYAGLLSFVSTRLSRRARPDRLECLRELPEGESCGPEAFWSGHTSLVAASAGLVCANHHYLPLWGHPLADLGACGLALSGAFVTGVSRLLSDRHYTTDVLVGMGVGFAFGYAVPVLAHYRRGQSRLALTIQPDALGAGASCSVSGAF